jgi:YcaO-like protein with predicted kinase domain
METAGITRVATITGLDRIGIPVVTACRPNSRSMAVSQGKGITLAAAKASAVMEAIECFHAEDVALPLRYGSASDLARSLSVVDTERLPRISATRFSAHQPTLWVAGEDLIRARPVLAPFETVHTDYRYPLPAGSGFFLMSSNGLASGNSRLEAISHGLCEVVERDANTLWKCGDDRTKLACRLALDTVTDADCRSLLDLCAAAEVDVAVWDVTSDVGIPTFRCEIADRRGVTFRPLRPMQGSGCHPRKEIALARSITEAAQSRATLISGSRDDLTQWFYDPQGIDESLSRFERDLARAADGLDFQRTVSFAADTIEADLAWMLDRLQAVGIEEVAVFDLSRAELGIPVVRVVIPGLEPMGQADGYVPGARAFQRYREARP